jgi:exodeoxyribonuclease-3
VRLRIASWNVNSVRLRIDQVTRFVAEREVDVLCLQEIKCRAGELPTEALETAGFPHVRVRGQKGSHGVAIASRLPIADAPAFDLCREGHARCVSGMVAGIEIVNLYVPAGGDVPDRGSPKFDHKLDFYERLTIQMSRRAPDAPLVLAGDLNVAPGEHDVWNHRIMSRVVSHTPIEVAAIEALRNSLGFIDPVREAAPEPAKLYSWWSYRAANFRASNRGRRLDHIWITSGLRSAATSSGLSAQIHDDVRAWDRPSDHAPITVDLTV